MKPLKLSLLQYNALNQMRKGGELVYNSLTKHSYIGGTQIVTATHRSLLKRGLIELYGQHYERGFYRLTELGKTVKVVVI